MDTAISRFERRIPPRGRPRSRSPLVALLLAGLLAFGAPVAAAAPTLDELRASGVVGERYDGVVVVRTSSADAGVRAVVDSVNAKRREIYAERAKKQGVEAREVGKVYALEIVENAPAGTWFLGEDGKWVQKK